MTTQEEVELGRGRPGTVQVQWFTVGSPFFDTQAQFDFAGRLMWRRAGRASGGCRRRNNPPASRPRSAWPGGRRGQPGPGVASGAAGQPAWQPGDRQAAAGQPLRSGRPGRSIRSPCHPPCAAGSARRAVDFGQAVAERVGEQDLLAGGAVRPRQTPRSFDWPARRVARRAKRASSEVALISWRAGRQAGQAGAAGQQARQAQSQVKRAIRAAVSDGTGQGFVFRMGLVGVLPGCAAFVLAPSDHNFAEMGGDFRVSLEAEGVLQGLQPPSACPGDKHPAHAVHDEGVFREPG